MAEVSDDPTQWLNEADYLNEEHARELADYAAGVRVEIETEEIRSRESAAGTREMLEMHTHYLVVVQDGPSTDETRSVAAWFPMSEERAYERASEFAERVEGRTTTGTATDIERGRVEATR